MRVLITLLATTTLWTGCGSDRTVDDIDAAPDDDQASIEWGQFECPYGGDRVVCDDEVHLTYDEVSTVGFSANDILPHIEGRYDFPIAWIHRCSDSGGCDLSGACTGPDDAALPDLVGTTSVLSVQVIATGQPAVVPHPGPDQADNCGRSMRIPATLSLNSDDGAVDAVHDVEIWSECGKQAGVSIVGPASVLGGRISDEVPAGAQVEFTFGTFDDRVWMDLYILAGVASRTPPLLEEEMLSDEPCPHDVPIDEVRTPL